MNKLSYFRKIIVMLAFIEILLLGGQYFLYSEIGGKNKNISKIKNNLEIQEKLQDYLVSTQKMLDSLSLDIENIGVSIIPKGGDVQFIEYLESMAKSNAIELKMENLSFEPNNFLDKSDFVSLKVKASTAGSWKGTYNFLLLLESLPYRTKISRFSMIASPVYTADGKKKGVVWNSNFEMTVLKYK